MNDEAFFAAFERSAIGASEWTHRAHLRAAWLMLERHPLLEAHLRMRALIIRQNERHGLVETPARGYHETLTLVWLALVDRERARSPKAADSQAFVDAHAGALGKDAPLAHYTKERLMSLEARSRWVEPNLKPL